MTMTGTLAPATKPLSISEVARPRAVLTKRKRGILLDWFDLLDFPRVIHRIARPLDPPILYGLLTEADVAELNRRKAKPTPTEATPWPTLDGRKPASQPIAEVAA